MANSAAIGTQEHPAAPSPIDTTQTQSATQRPDTVASSTSVEMSDLNSPTHPPLERFHTASSTADHTVQPSGTSQRSPVSPLTDASAPVDSTSPLETQSRPARPRQESSAIGSATETGNPLTVSDTNASGAAVLITLLLPSTGARHPFKIDSRYLQKRNLQGTQHEDPWMLSIYTVKELIWRDWRDEWEQRPTSPSSIRLIHFGKLLDDKICLKDCRLNATSTNVMHMSVRPQDIADDDETKLGKSTSRRQSHSDERSPRCRCIVQ